MESPQLLLPFAEREYVDVPRACRILGVSASTIYRMASPELRLIKLVDFRARSWKRVHYQSIVDHCNRLREEYSIPDHRPKLSSPIFRHRDEDLLPFQLRHTISPIEAAPALGFSTRFSVIKLAEEGCFEAYRLYPISPWRISLPSLQAYLDRVLNPEKFAKPSQAVARAAGACE